MMNEYVIENADFAMFTEHGNALVAELVRISKTFGLSDVAVLGMMDGISKDQDFAEITDTAVREIVGVELGFYK